VCLVCVDSCTLLSVFLMSLSTSEVSVEMAYFIADVEIHRSIGGIPVSLSRATMGVLLYAPTIRLRHLFCAFFDWT
jgi:hypothetical protein